MRVCLFTDTLGDVNGVSRFIRNAADQAAASGRSLTVLTSTRLPIPAAPHFRNIPPRIAGKMPKYEHLEIVLAPRRGLLRAAAELKPDVIHVSTPGPVGLVGRRAARALGVPLVGTYHTDFPAYVERLFDDSVMGSIATGVMRWFYTPFDRIFSRSEEYMDSMESAGLDRSRMVRLRPGMDTTLFRPELRNPSIWSRMPGPALSYSSLPGEPVRILSCGRVSIEKNLPLLVDAWRNASPLLASRGVAAELVVVGDGPYLTTMKERLSRTPTRFLGFRHGRELSELYASSDFFVFPSTTDTLGQVVMESQASGLPALVSDIGGPRSMIVEHATGHVLSGRDADAWTRAIVDLACDRDRRRRMGAAAHRHMAQYGFAASFDHFWSVHAETLEASRGHNTPSPMSRR